MIDAVRMRFGGLGGNCPFYSPLTSSGNWLARPNNNQRETEKQKVKWQATEFMVCAMSEYCAEHYNRKHARAIAGESRYQEKHHRGKFGDPNHDAKPVRIAPAMEIPDPKEIARYLQPTRPQADEHQKQRDYPKDKLLSNPSFRHRYSFLSGD
jgi:hypothetical protein